MADGSPTNSASADRNRRLAEALRENLKRRKLQARGRRAGEADGRDGLPAADDRPAPDPKSDRT
jgi:hypothetical protein